MAAFAYRRVPLMPLAGLCIVLIAAVAAFLISHGMAVGDRAINRSIEIRVRLAELGREIAAQNAGYRGYLLVAREEQAAETQEATAAIADHYARLNVILVDPAQRTRLARLAPLLAERVRTISSHIAARRHGGTGLSTGREREHQRRLVAAIPNLISKMSVAEQNLLESRERQNQRMVRWLSIALAGAVLLVVIAAYLTVKDARQRFLALRNANREARASAAAAASEAAAREEAEEQVRQMQKMESIGQLTGGIAHDFNNMLAVIVGSLDLARRRIDQPDRLSRHIADAMEGASRATTLVSRLLAFSRRQPLTPTPIQINAFLTELTELLRRVLGERIAVEITLDGGVWPIFADPVQLENSLLNLALNARDAMERGGTLTLATMNRTIAEGESIHLAPGQYVEVMVSDTGCGMDASVVARAFDPFFTTKVVGKGTGLGLSQVFGFVRQSGGEVTIESSVGVGSRFRLLLPRYFGTTEPPRVAPASGAPAAPVLRILLVEDDDRVRRYSADALAELGHVVLAAANGTEALRLLKDNPDVSLLLTDVVMPGMTGPELAAAVLAIRPDMRILYTTGYARDGDDSTAIAELDAPILLKPFAVADLDAKLRDILIA